MGVVCLPFDLAPPQRNVSFIAFLSSERIKLGFHFFFYCKCRGLAEKLLLIILIL